MHGKVREYQSSIPSLSVRLLYSFGKGSGRSRTDGKEGGGRCEDQGTVEEEIAVVWDGGSVGQRGDYGGE